MLVNKVINKVKKMEVCKQGKSSQARRALTIEELKLLMNKVKESEDPVREFGIPALCSF